jgi:hypothetical protein
MPRGLTVNKSGCAAFLFPKKGRKLYEPAQNNLFQKILIIAPAFIYYFALLC